MLGAIRTARCAARECPGAILGHRLMPDQCHTAPPGPSQWQWRRQHQHVHRRCSGTVPHARQNATAAGWYNSAQVLRKETVHQLVLKERRSSLRTAARTAATKHSSKAASSTTVRSTPERCFQYPTERLLVKDGHPVFSTGSAHCAGSCIYHQWVSTKRCEPCTSWKHHLQYSLQERLQWP